MRIYRTAAITALLIGFAMVTKIPAADSPGKTILVELFTSEGCSSCPPADAWLQKIDEAQPLAGSQIIVLSEHVDYWDHDGWKDPYSSHAITERQVDYVNSLHLESPYTPEIVVDGTKNLRPEDMRDVRQVFEKEIAGEKIPVSLNAVNVTSNALAAEIQVDGAGLTHSANVYVAAALDHAESQVLHGENGGRHLTHVSVLRDLQKVGTVKKGENFRQQVNLKLKSTVDPANVRVIAFAQEGGAGHVLGAAMWKPQSKP